VTLSVTLSRDRSLQDVNGLPLLGRADVAVDLHGRLAGRVPCHPAELDLKVTLNVTLNRPSQAASEHELGEKAGGC
jgi:hypothetical protein